MYGELLIRNRVGGERDTYGGDCSYTYGKGIKHSCNKYGSDSTGG